MPIGLDTVQFSGAKMARANLPGQRGDHLAGIGRRDLAIVDAVTSLLLPLDDIVAKAGVAVEDVERAGASHVAGEAAAAGKLLMVGERGFHQEAERGGRRLDLARPGGGDETGEERSHRRNIDQAERQRAERIEHPARHGGQNAGTGQRRDSRQHDDAGIAGRGGPRLRVTLEDGDVMTVASEPHARWRSRRCRRR